MCRLPSSVTDVFWLTAVRGCRDNYPDRFADEVDMTRSPAPMFSATVVRPGQLWMVKGSGARVLYTTPFL